MESSRIFYLQNREGFQKGVEISSVPLSLTSIVIQ